MRLAQQDWPNASTIAQQAWVLDFRVVYKRCTIAPPTPREQEADAPSANASISRRTDSRVFRSVHEGPPQQNSHHRRTWMGIHQSHWLSRLGSSRSSQVEQVHPPECMHPRLLSARNIHWPRSGLLESRRNRVRWRRPRLQPRLPARRECDCRSHKSLHRIEGLRHGAGLALRAHRGCSRHSNLARHFWPGSDATVWKHSASGLVAYGRSST